MCFGIDMKKVILIAILSLIALPVFGAVNYSRTPVGTEITSPVDVDVSVDSFSVDFGWNMVSGCFFVVGNQPCNFWGVRITNYDNDTFESVCIPVENLSNNFTFSLPVDNYIEVAAKTGNTQASCDNGGEQSYLLESNEGETIFTIISGSQFNNFHIISGTSPLTISSTSDVMASAGTLFSDLWVIIVLAIGIPLAFYIIKRIIKLAPASVPKSEKIDIEKTDTAGFHKGKATGDYMFDKRGQMIGYWKDKK